MFSAILKPPASKRGSLHPVYMIASQNEDNDTTWISKTTFFTGSLGIFSIGVLLGVRRVMKRNSQDAPSSNLSGALLAARALGWGTLLCLGAFAGIGAVYSTLTGITTAEQFGKQSKELIRKLGIEYVPTEEEKLELNKVEKEWDDYFDAMFKKDKKNTDSEISSNSNDKKDS